MKEVTVGCTIRSYDFAGILDHYVQGFVRSIEGDYIHFVGEVVCRDGVAEEIGVFDRKFMRTVRQGLMFGDAKFTRVEVL